MDRHIDLADFEIDKKSVQMLPYKFCEQNHAVILGAVDKGGMLPVSVGMLEPDSKPLVEKIRRTLGRPIRAVQLSASDIKKALDIGYDRYDPTSARSKLQLTPVTKLSFSPDLPASDVLDQILGHAVNLGANDVHFERFEDDVDVRYRLNGILHQINTPLDAKSMGAIVSRLKVLSELDISEKRKAQDGLVSATYNDHGEKRHIDLRISILPGPNGEDAVLRIADSARLMLGLDSLGMSKPLLTTLRTLIHNPEGMLLVTGPTGSGKTATLYSILGEVNTDQNKLLTVEDPIEFVLPKANQKQVSSRMGFADYARAFLRHDPDIIAIGEIRDEATAAIAAKAAQTGHLVVSTVHSRDTTSTLTRLKTLGLPPGLLSQSLLGVLSQRLVRCLCSECREEMEPSAFARRVFERFKVTFPVFRARGCKTCLDTGYRSRAGIFELLFVNQRIADLIASDHNEYEIWHAARVQGMQTLFRDAVEKVRVGSTTFAELRRVLPIRLLDQELSL